MRILMKNLIDAHFGEYTQGRDGNGDASKRNKANLNFVCIRLNLILV